MTNTQAIRQRGAELLQSAPVRWLLQARRIPMYFAVTILVSIFYHYSAAGWVPFWIVSALLIQSGLFKLFDFVKKRPFIGGTLYVVIGLVFLLAAGWFIVKGYDSPLFAPDDYKLRINFFVWFMTPQSVLTTQYPGYTLGLYLLFSYFIGSIVYYFTMVRYRVLMSFMTMMFPFAIYAKEDDVMPVLCIILLFAFYFAVMIYCRQARAEDPDVTQPLKPQQEYRIPLPGKRSPFYGQKPELLDGRFLRAGGIFLAGASILVLMIPKPAVTANRQLLDTMLDISSLSDYLMQAISGFADESDGGTYTGQQFTRTLYFAKAEEPLNLRMRTFTNYDYAGDKWLAGDYDGVPAQDDYRYHIPAGSSSRRIRAISDEPLPADLYALAAAAAAQYPEFGEKYGLTGLRDVSAAHYIKRVELEASSYNSTVYPAPLQTQELRIQNSPSGVFRNGSGILFRYGSGRVFREHFTAEYLSPDFYRDAEITAYLSHLSTENYGSFLIDLQQLYPDDDTAAAAVGSFLAAQEYARSVVSQTPERVRQLAAELTRGKTGDFEKAMAIRDHLKYGDYLYQLDFLRTEADSVETFLFERKTGVCYQFATAMTELCRAAGLYARYVEGYSMSTEYSRATGDWDYLVSTDDAHAFCDVYIAGSGWVEFDATASGSDTVRAANPGNVVSTLQYSGFILLGIAVVLVFTFVWLIPALREQAFRRRFRKNRDPKVIAAAYARLRKQWQADPAETASALCGRMSSFLQTDLTELTQIFEETVYAERCSTETADRFYRAYCAAYDAFRPAQRRARREARAARKKKHQTNAPEGAA